MVISFWVLKVSSYNKALHELSSSGLNPLFGLFSHGLRLVFGWPKNLVFFVDLCRMRISSCFNFQVGVGEEVKIKYLFPLSFPVSFPCDFRWIKTTDHFSVLTELRPNNDSFFKTLKASVANRNLVLTFCQLEKKSYVRNKVFFFSLISTRHVFSLLFLLDTHFEKLEKLIQSVFLCFSQFVREVLTF